MQQAARAAAHLNREAGPAARLLNRRRPLPGRHHALVDFKELGSCRRVKAAEAQPSNGKVLLCDFTCEGLC